MGKVIKAATSLIGLSGAPKAQSAPVVVKAQENEIEDQSKTAKATRASLFSTTGGVLGEELAPGQVKKRQTLLGN